MKKLETILQEKTEEWNTMEAPAEMEDRLRQALQENKRRMPSYKPIAAILAVVLLFTYSFDSLAYYGKKFTGYDGMTVGSLKKLNEEGKGQEINKSCTFSNGVTVTIDGFVFDDNHWVFYYKVHCESGNLLEDVLKYNLPQLHAYGISPEGYNLTGGQGTLMDEQHMSFVDTLEPPRFYEKWMKLEVQLKVENVFETQTIRFTLNRNQAMEKTATVDLKAEARLGDYKILFDKLSASAMSSVISGRIIALTDDALNAFRGETAESAFVTPHLRFDMVSDNGEVSTFSGGQSASGSNISFHSSADALPKDFITLQLKNIRFETMKLVDKTIEVGVETTDLQMDDDLIIKKIIQENDAETCVILSSRGIPVVGLSTGDLQLDQLNAEALEYEPESEQPVDRVYRFQGTGSNLMLSVKFIRYSEYSADTVNIPID